VQQFLTKNSAEPLFFFGDDLYTHVLLFSTSVVRLESVDLLTVTDKLFYLLFAIYVVVVSSELSPKSAFLHVVMQTATVLKPLVGILSFPFR